MKIKSLAKHFLYCSGFYHFKYAIKTSGDKRLLILMYHDLVENKREGECDPISYGKLDKNEFEAVLIAIKNTCRVTSVEEAVKEIKDGGGLKENSIALTFDDGYVSVYDIAFPLLRKYDAPATIYLPTDWINGNISLWWHDLTDMILEFEPDDAIYENLIKIGKDSNFEFPRFPLQGILARLKLRDYLSSKLMKISDGNRLIFIEKMRATLFGDAAYKKLEINPMTWEQVAEMAKAGFIFGAHTCSHINLSHADLDKANEEIAVSKGEIEKRLGYKISGFAYPYGYDISGYKRIEPLLQNLGFDYACTTYSGSNNNKSNLFQLYRNTIPPLKSTTLLKRELYLDLAD